MNVLSLFDGISSGQVALQRLGIKVDTYYASEIDEDAIKITNKNFPNTNQLGDVRNLKGMQGIDLLMGGSPCQGFSFAGKVLNFDDPRSLLFFEYHRVLQETNPTYFLYENVKMNKRSEQVITDMLGVEPIEINSGLLSAQNRVRLYWTNIPNVTQPKDKGISLKDIVLDDEYIIGGARRGRDDGSGKWVQRLELRKDNKSNTLTTAYKDTILVSRHYKPNDDKSFDKKDWRNLTLVECERLQTLPDNYTEGVGKISRRRTLGNGWTVDVIAHIFEPLKKIYK